ncbi:RNA polymerase sigma factor [Streptomyces sp. CB02009]|uniref:RNA polymerase sigma factor n=1 Tax=Streptomyces sp. CB02009 TaxID=1703938 RepID=UPI0023794F06|nr:sigma factor-like helix-turn-helix DNA-binding protein [Streptomyces sp. CB02009]
MLQGMSALPSSQRAVLEMVAVDGLTVTEAAAALRISTVAARVRLHRARRAMQGRLAKTAGPRSAPSPSVWEVS